MTTEIEEQFFKVFGVEPKKQGYCDWQSDCPYPDIKCGDDCPYWKYENELKYPEITDRKLLEMICILNSTNGVNCTAYESKNIGNLKIEILYECISISDDIELKTKIQQLFKEGE